jgi:hypothetical protein
MLRRDFLLLSALPLLPAVEGGAPVLGFLAQNRYFAKAGRAQDVYDLRLHACDVLERIGVARGVVFRGRGGTEPDAIWQVSFTSRDAMREARRKVSDNAEFRSVQERMGTLIRRFEASVYQEAIPTIVDDKSGRA